MSDCNDNRLVLEIKQGSDRGYGFIIKQGGEPFDLTNYTVEFQVKRAPYYVLPSLIEKTITLEEVLGQGQIYEPTKGEFKVYVTKDETLKLPVGDYSLIITLINGTNRIPISGEGNNTAIFRICYQ